MTDYPGFHPLANIFPLMVEGSSEYEAFADDIRARGVLNPITMYQGLVLDGRNRVVVCDRTGIPSDSIPRVEFEGADPFAFVVSMNLYRRHLTKGQLAAIAHGFVTSKHGGKGRFSSQEPNLALGTEVTLDQAVKILNNAVSKNCVKQFSSVSEKCLPEIVEGVRDGRVSLWKAHNELAKCSEDDQRLWIATKGYYVLNPRLQNSRKKGAKPKTASLAQSWADAGAAGRNKFYDTVIIGWVRDGRN
jgi:hypothetical protein